MKCIIYHNVISVSERGLSLGCKKNSIDINFEECAKNYATEFNLKVSKCVATRDIATLSFTFYTQPKTKVVFKKRFTWNKSGVSNFFKLQKAIINAGYTSYDLS